MEARITFEEHDRESLKFLEHSKNLDLMTLLSEGSKENEEHVAHWRKGDPLISSARKLTEIVSCSYVQSRTSK